MSGPVLACARDDYAAQVVSIRSLPAFRLWKVRTTFLREWCTLLGSRSPLWTWRERFPRNLWNTSRLILSVICGRRARRCARAIHITFESRMSTCSCTLTMVHAYAALAAGEHVQCEGDLMIGRAAQHEVDGAHILANACQSAAGAFLEPTDAFTVLDALHAVLHACPNGLSILYMSRSALAVAAL